MMETLELEKLELGIPEIDHQHMGFFRLVDRCEKAADGGETHEFVEEILEQLVDYIDEHFSYEKEAMRKVDYPGIKVHQQEHAFFVRKVMDVFEDAREGICPLKNGMLEFLKDWFSNHIMTTDQRMAIYFKENGYEPC